MSALSHAQERLWFLDRLTPGDGAYNMVVCERLAGPLDADALERALSEIVARHEALRTVFPGAGGAPVARVLDPEPVVMERLDLEGEPSPEAIAERSNRPFDLAAGPLLRATLMRSGPREHLFLLVVHHIAGDAWSIEQILLAELAALYAAFTEGRPSPLAPPPRQYGDHVRAQRERPADVAGPARELDGVPVLELPTDRPRPAVRSADGDLVIHRVPVELWRRVTELARAERCTPFMAVLAAYQVLLSRYSGQEDFCVGTPVAGRDNEEFERVFGVFINTLALRADLGGDPSFRELLKRVRRRAFTMYGHAAVPFERLVSEMRLDRDPARTPLFQTMLMLSNPDGGSIELAGLHAEPVVSGLISAKFDLSLNVVVYPTHVQLMVDYSTALYDRSTVERMAVHFETLLGSVTAAPGSRLSELEILPDAERATVLGESPEDLARRRPDGNLEFFDRIDPAEAVDLRAEAVLPGDIAFSGAPIPQGPPSRVLLTGATGFLGAHLLAELLYVTEATVHCLVRGEAQKERLRANLERYGLWDDWFAWRIVVEPGELGVPRLGLQDGRFAELAETADLVVHNGAQVNVAWPYRRLRGANVDGVLDILRLASSGGRTTPVHLVSTLGVHLTPGERTVREGDPLPDPGLLSLGYDQSKWVADRLADAARRTGLPISIHRPARVSAHSRTAMAMPGDFLGRFFETCVRLGSVPDGERLDMAPVDHVASAIVHLALSGVVGDFHHHNPRVLRSAVLAQGLNERGFPVRLTPGDEWRRLVRDRIAVGDDLPIARYPAFLAEHGTQAGPSFDCSATEETLARAGLVCPPADAELLGRYLDHYIAAGVLAGGYRA
ncbi:thioester reductase domain-containing protein [Streptosporangium sp. NPDC051023]|uniref:thioester reductase domain-containing protein n=1 Tax=Streptosporangium sp. NPDC051023 TaxID=3155410 RepID=UPI00344B3E52